MNTKETLKKRKDVETYEAYKLGLLEDARLEDFVRPQLPSPVNNISLLGFAGVSMLAATAIQIIMPGQTYLALTCAASGTIVASCTYLTGKSFARHAQKPLAFQRFASQVRVADVTPHPLFRTLLAWSFMYPEPHAAQAGDQLPEKPLTEIPVGEALIKIDLGHRLFLARMINLVRAQRAESAGQVRGMLLGTALSLALGVVMSAWAPQKPLLESAGPKEKVSTEGNVPPPGRRQRPAIMPPPYPSDLKVASR